MPSDKCYRIRRGIVTALYDYLAPQDLDTVACAPEILLENLTPDMLCSEWDNLITSGIIEPLAGYPGVAKLAPGIRSAIRQNHGKLPQIEALYGSRVL